jgi:hypothetical protein
MSLPKNEKYEAIYYVGHVGLFEFLMSLLDLEMKGLFTEPTLRMDLGGCTPGCTVLNLYESTWVHMRGIDLDFSVLRK